MKKSEPVRKRRSTGSARLARIFRPGRMMLIVISMLAGGLLFNLDRISGDSLKWREIRALIPRRVQKFLPGGGETVTVRSDGEFTGRVIDVHDGDTVTVLMPDGTSKCKIRLYGIDAPELAQAGGPESRDHLAALIGESEVLVSVVSRDNYGRSVCRIFVDGLDVNKAMVLDGWAWHYQAYARKEKDLEAAQSMARERGRGLWASPSPVPPWEYRKKKK